MSQPPVQALREIFDGVAELYDRVRPHYPSTLFDDLAQLTGLCPGARVLEIGCGTGQATLPLAQLGCEITALDLGPGMCRVARRNLAPFPAAQVLTTSFEEWPLPAEPFDVVLSATAFHWVDPAIRVVKAADALRLGGALVTVMTEHIAGGTGPFFAAAQTCYERWDPATPPGLTLQPSAEIPMDAEELASSGRFDRVVFRRYEQEHTYSADGYLDVLRTYSGHCALDAVARGHLLACIANLINTDYGGSITKRYLFELRIAWRTA